VLNLEQHFMTIPVKIHFDKIILGIDPGSNIMGFALIGIKKNEMHLLEFGYKTMASLENHIEKLKGISEHIAILIEKYKPDEMAIEAPFFGKNVQSMLKLGRAQGVAMAVAITKGVSITEYSAKKIKQSVTGNGNASKEQVAGVLEHILKQKLDSKNMDATDALAIAVCHHFQKNNHMGQGPKYSGWDSFLSNNPERKLK
jgi:crossover junction endodeoxyribonuclease RuvC